ncbi:tryptophan 7-halogenase [Sphingomonas limnosediminicola]|uniref:Tryptophan 7-halogenase n=1 Tax=Sphingomonas limnosediminicola TaxID=940133 RepID=A0ABP7LNA5_9SPHN
MVRSIQRIVIAGGGTAGWLAACRIAAWAMAEARPIEITLVESPDIPTVGVGEGTWPTMRETLAEIGIDEVDFLSAADASFKQGSRFDGWRDGSAEDRYFHPFTAPTGTRDPRQLLACWKQAPGSSFAGLMTSQNAVAEANLAPRQRTMPAYAGALNYAYHLDAGKFVDLLRRHAVQRLGVTHLSDRIDVVEGDDDGGIKALLTTSGKRIEGDLFIDCTGHSALLIQGHCQSGWADRSDILFNDRALAAQVPVSPQSPIASQTVSTAHRSGWIWDIALPGRRGIGCVYSSKFLVDSEAEQILDDYIASALPDADPVQPRRLVFPTGHRTEFWKSNCVAVGLSAGFVEPLEASAIVLIELSLRALIDNFPASRATMPLLAERFNLLFLERWDRIVEFLKLHYVLSERDEPYWRAHRNPASFPSRLAGLLELWRDQPPSTYDLPSVEEIFPAASYQYVYYGMGGKLPDVLPEPSAAMTAQLDQVAQRTRSLLSALPTNRAYLDATKVASQRTVEEQA